MLWPSRDTGRFYLLPIGQNFSNGLRKCGGRCAGVGRAWRKCAQTFSERRYSVCKGFQAIGLLSELELQEPRPRFPAPLHLGGRGPGGPEGLGRPDGNSFGEESLWIASPVAGLARPSAHQATGLTQSLPSYPTDCFRYQHHPMKCISQEETQDCE